MAAHSCTESRVKAVHDLDDVVVKLHQGWDNRLDFPPTKLPKRYVSNELAIGLELECEFSPFVGGHLRYSALIQMPCNSLGYDAKPRFRSTA